MTAFGYGYANRGKTCGYCKCEGFRTSAQLDAHAATHFLQSGYKKAVGK